MPQIHFEKSKARLHALFQRPPHVAAGVPSVHVGVAVDAHLVAVPAAQQLVQRHAVVLAHDVPQRDLDARHAAALPGVTAELFYPGGQLFHVKRILPQQPAFEHQRVGGAGRVAHFPVADDARVGTEFQQYAMFGHAVYVRHAQIGDFRFAFSFYAHGDLLYRQFVDKTLAVCYALSMP